MTKQIRINMAAWQWAVLEREAKRRRTTPGNLISEVVAPTIKRPEQQSTREEDLID
jgi:hypothetical protein